MCQKDRRQRQLIQRAGRGRASSEAAGAWNCEPCAVCEKKTQWTPLCPLSIFHIPHLNLGDESFWPNLQNAWRIRYHLWPNPTAHRHASSRELLQGPRCPLSATPEDFTQHRGKVAPTLLDTFQSLLSLGGVGTFAVWSLLAPSPYLSWLPLSFLPAGYLGSRWPPLHITLCHVDVKFGWNSATLKIPKWPPLPDYAAESIHFLVNGFLGEKNLKGSKTRIMKLRKGIITPRRILSCRVPWGKTNCTLSILSIRINL